MSLHDAILLEVLRSQLREHGERTALIDEGGSVTYRELVRAVEDRRHQLDRFGITDRSRVGLVAGNDITSVITFAAANALGAAVLLLHERMRPGERDSALSHFGATAVLDQAGERHASAPQSADLPHGPALALATSGTSGRPKVVQREWAGSMANSHAHALALGLNPVDGVLTTSPLNHSYAIEGGVLAALAVGASHVIPPVPTAPVRLRELADRGSSTVLQSVPALLRWYGQDGIPRARTWKSCVSAGDRLPAEVAEQWARADAPLWNHYGASEIGQISIGPAESTGSVGLPVEGVALRTPGSTRDAAGTVEVRCSGLTPRLLSAGRAEPLADGHGWVEMDDVGLVDALGRLQLTGRRGRLINVAGNKVDPAEVEQVIRRYPGIADCAVVGRQGPDDDAQVCAFVELSAEGSAAGFDTSALRREVRGQLSASKVPAVVHVVDELPRTGTGKVRKGLLGELVADSPEDE